jgi:voltage-gated potassium channel
VTEVHSVPREVSPEAPPEAAGRFLGYQLLIVTASMLSLGIMAALAFFPLAHETRTILDTADVVVCGLFLVDFAVSLAVAKNRTSYMVTWGWLDLLSAIPAIDLARWGRAARVLRVLRVLRVMRATRIMAGLAYRHRARNAAMAGGLLLVLIVFASSIAILHFEDIEGGNIRSGHDAMWWAVTTVSTVGYGDFYPVTWEGRLIAVLLMVTGVGTFAAIAAGLASWFMQPPEKPEITRLADEVERLRCLLEARLGDDGDRDRTVVK